MKRLNKKRLEFARLRGQTILEGNFGRILHNVVIGDRVYIGDRCVIGSPGFGYAWSGHAYEHIKHDGGVIIGDDVTIHAMTQICSGTVDPTIIEKGCKIDSFVHIAHNVHLEPNVMITAGAIIGGSCYIEEGAYVGINAVIRNKVRIGAGAIIGMGAVVTKDVPAGVTMIGNPARVMETTK